ncbi:MAG: ABC transporter permease [Halothiobacillus sp. 14-56-357]|jgi:lipoprotein-releasing system permease protein|uniref:lipoprotein-releasing ABC transporter permease subunit n=1 Tax=Halothiobacillus sp. 15-55-196 TaxID=1970382 RepID=UPI000BD8C678|nr:lipoprotein-releasing ABC transporter permease subunit [Halothiobacillus sp. 15-55-196]OZB36465.1 MAG: ABC transporter permease [Halothiobacillus sp. 15-55-196]OZB57540.1 MAG: ABC transporter permease [Halothiobacillus sp. 14-56-357]OZB78530.1 MAG: ABC transporter permease [Halothiobacillus sp. 13-55-115]
MFRSFEWLIGLRYTRAKRRNRFVSFISATSIIGITLGVTALIVVISVMNGFQDELRHRILGMTAHATISENGQALQDWRSLAQKVQNEPDVVASAPYVQAEAMLSAQPNVSGAIIRGIEPKYENDVTDIGKHMVAGSLSDLKPGGFGIVLGEALAQSLGVAVGDKLMLITANVAVTPVGGLLRQRQFTVVGIFKVGMYEYDRGSAFIDLKDAQALFRMGDGVTGLRLKLDDMFRAPWVARDLNLKLGNPYWTTDWTQANGNFFRAVQTERTVMFIILSLIVAVAAFNIVSTLVMVVTDKRGDIAILRTLGASPGSIMRIFLISGTVIGLIGTLIGVGFGVLIASNVETIVPWIEHLTGTQFMPADVYYISEVPSRLDWNDVWHVGLMAFGLSFLATIYPAWSASRVQPAEALRYE